MQYHKEDIHLFESVVTPSLLKVKVKLATLNEYVGFALHIIRRGAKQICLQSMDKF